jgi:hypothetical protein
MSSRRHMEFHPEFLASDPQPHRSPDQAFHLAGYGPECGRKATLSFRWLDKAIGHRFDASTERLLDLALNLDPVAYRYTPRDWRSRYGRLSEWNEQSRYEGRGTYPQPRVESLLADARAAVAAVDILSLIGFAAEHALEKASLARLGELREEYPSVQRLASLAALHVPLERHRAVELLSAPAAGEESYCTCTTPHAMRSPALPAGSLL